MKDNRKPPLYNLCGVVYHFGGLNGGHYTAACLNSETNIWYGYNDSLVCEINDLQQIVTSDAYILVY